MVRNGLKRCSRHRVDRVRGDQIDDVSRVAERFVLYTCGRPEEPLRTRAACRQGLPTRRAPHVFVYLVGKARVGDGGWAMQPPGRGAVFATFGLSLREPAVGFCVDTTDEKRGDAFDSRQVATRGLTCLQPRQEGLDHRLVS